MVESLLLFLVWLLVVGFVVWVVLLLLDRAPIDATFKQVGKGVVVLIAIIILIWKLIPMISSLG